MEGKRADWEGIVKVPFVDEVRGGGGRLPAHTHSSHLYSRSHPQQESLVVCQFRTLNSCSHLDSHT